VASLTADSMHLNYIGWKNLLQTRKKTVYHTSIALGHGEAKAGLAAGYS